MTDNFVGETGDEFEKFVGALYRRLGGKVVTSWMSDLRLERRTGDSVTLSTESQIKCDTIGQRFVILMKEAWCEEVGPIRRLLVVKRDRLSAGAARVDALKPSNTSTGNGHALSGLSATAKTKGGQNTFKFAKSERKIREEVSGPHLDDLLLPIDQCSTFERFAVDHSNEMACAAARQVFADDAPSVITYLHGPSGVGKSHLLFAIGNEHRRRNGASGCAYLTYNAMQSGCVSAVFSNGIHALHKDLQAQDIVLIDDIHHLISSPRTQTEILNLINAFLATGRKLVIAGELSPAKLAEAGINARLADRLSGGLSVALRPGDAALRARVLKLRLETAAPKCTIDDEAIDYVAQNFPQSLREAIGALNQLLLVFGQQDVKVGREEASAALRVRLGESWRKPSLDETAAAAAAAFDISIDELKGRGQYQRLVRARHAFVMVGRESLRESFPRLARTLDRDHTTAMSGYQRAQALWERDKQFRAAITTIRETVGLPLS